MRTRSLLLAGLVCLYAACADDTDLPICERLNHCEVFDANESELTCEMVFGVLVMSEACTEAIFAAPCPEFGKPSGERSFADVCYPKCDASSPNMCAGDLLVVCEAERLSTIDCKAACSILFEENREYLGCGPTHPVTGGPSPDGEAECWCKAPDQP